MQNIFIVDDNQTNLATGVSALSGKYNVFTMTDPEKIFQIAKKSFPDCILLDINMPGIGGLQALKRLSEDETFCDVPVIMVTAEATGDKIIQSIQNGAKAFIRKPFEEAKLLERIRSVLG